MSTLNYLKRISTPSKFRSFLSSIARNITSNQPEEVVQVSEEVKDPITVTKDGLITSIGINRPEKKNALDSQTAESLREALDRFENDEDAVAGVLYGVGGNFCSGFDLREIANYDGESEESVPQFGPLSNGPRLCRKPLIGALSGYVLGFGLELALMCDLTVAEDTTVLGFYNRRYGVPIMSGGTVRLPAIIGYRRAMDMILTGRAITAQEAFNWGLVNHYVACGTALGKACAMAQSLVKFPQKTLLADRMSAHYSTFSSKEMEEALQFEKDNSSHLLLEEGVPGAKKFLDGTGRHGKFYHLTKVDRTVFKELDKDLL